MTENGNVTQQTIIFCPSIGACTEVYQYLMHELGENAYIQDTTAHSSTDLLTFTMQMLASIPRNTFKRTLQQMTA